MIRYALRCGAGHEFEGWFRSSAAFGEEAAALACPICGDGGIEKAIMAPAVMQRATPSAEPELQPAPAAAPPAGGAVAVAGEFAAPAMPAAALTPRQVELARALVAMRRLKAHVEAHFENVGKRFAEEARKIHHEEAEARDIFGQATLEEARELLEEGIEVLPLPDLPKLDG
ncbi:MAG: DUF1178 family protein [Geminicoccaceae bacterium]|nr:DUF1178 family protein [Geminicoccaceae bacterium]MCB9967918.1 DUF1178 family protein [Geminicoccaceae bacterium]HRY27219.1 DUF1178 family protein [Geminicoccaceae bacterium]